MKQILLLSAALLLLCNTIKAQNPYWQQVPSGTDKKLASASFGSPQVGYISGADSLLLRTVNGGISWAPVSHSGLGLGIGNPDIIHVNFLSAASGYAIIGDLDNPVYRGSLYKTSDSGRNWTAVNAGNIAMSRTYFFDANNGYGVGSAFFAGHTIVKQTGGTWTGEKTLLFDPSKFLYGIDFRNPLVGIVGGNDGLVYRTFNGGANWDTVQTLIDTTINSLQFLNDSTIMAGTDNNGGGIIISTDTGRTWEIEMNTLTFAYPAIKAIAVSARDSFIAVGHASFGNYGIILWNDTTFAFSHMQPQRLNDVSMRDASVAFIVGDSGTILTNRQAVLGVSGSNPIASAARVYPNPASGIFNTEASYQHSVRVLDMTGRLVLDDSRPAMRHTLEIDKLSPGIYIVETRPVQGAPVYERLVID
jgi:photosystem II stability/assembly factor-like uncharacterized protein